MRPWRDRGRPKRFVEKSAPALNGGTCSQVGNLIVPSAIASSGAGHFTNRMEWQVIIAATMGHRHMCSNASLKVAAKKQRLSIQPQRVFSRNQ